MANPLIRKFPKRVNKPMPNKSAGILDDFAVRKNVCTKDGTIESTPTADNHIANKKYVDDLTDIKLTDNSIANTLHRHSELVASDGSPDPAVSVDASGNVGIGTTGPQGKFHTVAGIVSNVHYDLNTAMCLENDNPVMQIVGSDEGSAAEAIMLSSAPVSGDNKHWMIHHTGVDENDRLEFTYGTSAASGNIFGSIMGNQKMVITTDGNVGIGTTAPSEKLDVNSDAIRIRTAQTPASASATGDAGMICWDANYIYVCTATNTWKRTAIATW